MPYCDKFFSILELHVVSLPYKGAAFPSVKGYAKQATRVVGMFIRTFGKTRVLFKCTEKHTHNACTVDMVLRTYPP